MEIKTSMIALKEQLFSSVKLYPLASLAAFVFTVACWTLIYEPHDSVMLKMALASSFGFFLLSAVYHWRRDSITLGSGVALPILYYFSLPSPFVADTIFVNQYIVILVTSLILLAVLPFVQKRESNLKFWAWELNIFLALLSSGVFGLILYGGLAGAIKASSVLFEFAVSGKYYAYLFVFIMGLFSSHYFLSSLKLNEIDTQKALYNRFGNFFVKYILTSIASVYAFILSGYVLKILVTQEWPNGILVWLSLVFASLSLATYLFWTPLGGKYRKLLIGAALVQLSLLFIAIEMRVSQYGWSSDRYMVTMLGIWFGVTFLYLIISKVPRYEWPFALLALFLLISQYGWKLSAYEVSDRSQAHRLMKVLAENPHFSDKTPKEVRCAVSSSLDILEHHNNKEYLIQVMPETVKKYDAQHAFVTHNAHRHGFAAFATRELGFKHLNAWECSPKYISQAEFHNRSFHHSWEGPIPISGYDSLIHNREIIQFRKDRGDQPNSITITDNGVNRGEFDVSDVAKRLMQTKNDADMNQPATSEPDIPEERFIYTAENADIAIRIYFEYLNISEESVVMDARGIVLIREKNNQR